MTATTVARCLTDDPALIAEIERELSALSPEECEAALGRVDDILTALHREGRPVLGDSAQLLRAVRTAADAITTSRGNDAQATATEGTRPDVHLTDMGNAERLVRLHGKDLLYAHELDCWFVWDGTRWARDETGEIDRRAKATVRFLYDDAIGTEDPELKRALVKHALDSESERRLRAMALLARSALPVRVAELDARPMLLNTPNGVVDLATGQLIPHDRSLRMTRIAAARYVEEAESRTWNEFLERFIPPEEQRAFLARAAGYTLLGTGEQERLFFVHGPTWSGKSTFLGAFHHTLGNVDQGGYAAFTPFKTFLARRNDDGPRNDLARLVGARLVTAIEVGEGRRFDEALIKSITGRDPITCRFLFKEWFTYTPQFVVWLGANTLPAIDADDPAVRRRFSVVPFPVGLAEGDVDPTIKERLIHDPAEREALLALLVRGALAYQREGLVVPEVVKATTFNFFAEHDSIGRFFDECCDFGPDRRVTAGILRHAYEVYCEQSGVKVESGRRVGHRLRGRGCERADDRDHTWLGVALRFAPEGYTP